ncbi:hypothetical protein DAEQUDRAFT_769561 [Daedalea quercina L-15889]|uniref:Fungal-type protein kinase domain-containing protein n=1 Tax=Daedalea quercina L-15889 TaxID=1314783 RepID=A0A165LLC1_9APHY|nr:hypothetical protein DAEQUDRAFT_769561 [Daedalea quercina L-15889]
MSPLARAFPDYDSSEEGSQPPSPIPEFGHGSPTSSHFSGIDYFSDDLVDIGGPDPSQYASSDGFLSEVEVGPDASRASHSASPSTHLDNDSSAPLVPALDASVVPEPSVQEAVHADRPASTNARPSTPPDQQSHASTAPASSTPVASKASSRHPHSVLSFGGAELTPQLRREYADEMETKTAQVSLETFMREFVPGPDVPPVLAAEAFNPANFQHTEDRIRDELCKVANSVFGQIPAETNTEKLVAKDTYIWPDPTDKNNFEQNTRPDVMVYPVNDDARRAYTLSSTALKKKKEAERKRCAEKEARIAWSWARLFIEAKTNYSDTPFHVPQRLKRTPGQEAEPPQTASSSSLEPDGSAEVTDPLTASASFSSATPGMLTSAQSTAPQTPSATGAAEPNPQALPSFLRTHTAAGKHTMGQMVQYVSKILQRQFLAYVFTIFTCRDVAWLLRWDRAGLIVSEPFSRVEEPQHFHTFLYRFACMNDVQRGRDPTVVPASSAEVKLMRSVDRFDSTWHKIQYTATLTAGWPIYKVLVPEEDTISTAELKQGEKATRAVPEGTSSRKREFLVGKPHFMTGSPTGGGTRGYFAYDIAEHRLVFFKECWRLDAPTYHPEGEVYLRLHSKNVPYIATPVAAGDVCDATDGMHCTRAQEFLPGVPPKLIQYRIILKEIGKPLEEYETSLGLVSAMYCCIYAHEKAWTEGEVLHRDISRGNLLMYPVLDEHGQLVWLGMVVDWGLCKYKDELGLPHVQKTRSGTWQFMSAVLLAYPGVFTHEVWHDLESFIHVLHWFCLRFHKTDYSEDKERLLEHVRMVYDRSYLSANGISTGGQAKLRLMKRGDLPFDLIEGSAGQSGPGLYRLLTDLARLYKEHYKWLEPRLSAVRRTGAHSNSQTHNEPQNQSIWSNLSLFPPPRNVGSEVAPTVSEAPAQPVLENHTKVLNAFEIFRHGEWLLDKKTEDQFAHSNTLMDQQARLKRSSEESISLDERSGKRVRSPTGSMSVSAAPQLGSIREKFDGKIGASS